MRNDLYKYSGYDGLPTGIFPHTFMQEMNLEDKLYFIKNTPYLYNDGFFEKDEDGILLKSKIKDMICECDKDGYRAVTPANINSVYQLFMTDSDYNCEYKYMNYFPSEWVNFRDGMYNPVIDVLMPHKADYLCTYQIPYNYSEVKAGAKLYDGCVADNFIKDLIPDEEDRKMVYTFFGLCFTRYTKLQKMLILKGEPGAGKSELLNHLLGEALGDDNYSTITLHNINERFYPALLLDKVANICGDIPTDALPNDDTIKRAIGEDSLLCEHKGVDGFKFHSVAKLIFSANEKLPEVNRSSYAFFRRLLICEIPHKTKPIPHLRKELHNCIEPFIGNCMKHLHEFMQHPDMEIDSPNSKKAVQEYFNGTDSVNRFITARGIGTREKSTVLYNSYKDYCHDYKEEAKSRQGFFKALRDAGFAERIVHGTHYYERQINTGKEAVVTNIRNDSADNWTDGGRLPDDIPFNS